MSRVRKQPFPMVETEVLNSALLGLTEESDLSAALAEFDDTVEFISGHRRDTLRHV